MWLIQARYHQCMMGLHLVLIIVIFQLVSSACYLVSINFFAPCVLHPVLQCRQLFSHSAVTRCFCALNQAFLSCDQGAKLPGTFRIMGSFTSLTIRGCVSVGKAVHMLLFTSSFQKPLEFPKMDLTLGLLWVWLITQSARLLQLGFGKHVCSDVFTKASSWYFNTKPKNVLIPWVSVCFEFIFRQWFHLYCYFPFFFIDIPLLFNMSLHSI